MKLLPCPFCGSDKSSISYCSEDYKSFVVVCDECRSEGPEVPVHTVKKRESGRHKAAELWNTRAAKQTIRGITNV
jgi:Lar family restriction alleviation protein